MRNILAVILFILWLLLGWCYCLQPCCDDDASIGTTTEKDDSADKIDATSDAVVEKSGPLLYNWSNHHPIFGEGWADERDRIAAMCGENKILQITGHYRKDETNNTTFENLGLARVDSLMRYFSNYCPPEQIRISSRLVGADDADRHSKFESASFKSLVNTENVKEVDDKALIYFPYGSTNKLNAADVESYLDDVAERVNKSGETVHLEGHTDSSGSSSHNMRLGQRRAQVIKDYLVRKGMSASKVKVTSKGEEDSIATNDTKASMAKNRRTELTIK